MDVNHSKTKIEQANQHLEEAKNELNRPAEDVVPYMVCRSARYSISHYLQAFLLKHEIEFDQAASVETLLAKCRAMGDTFNSFDLSAITFTKDDEYSAAFDEMEKCIDLAEFAKQLVSE